MAKKKRADREAARRVAQFQEQQRRLSRRRNILGVLGLIPLLAFASCDTPLALLCAVPRDWLLLIWAAAFGSFLGLTIRLVLERRRYERAAAGGRTA